MTQDFDLETRGPLWGATVLRVGLGTTLVAHGLLKAFVFTPAGTADFFASVGFPAALALPTILFEVVGGFLLIAGLCTRAVALAALPVLIGATSVHLGNGWLFTNEGGGWEFPAFLALAAAAQAMLGDGAAALGRVRIGRPSIATS